MNRKLADGTGRTWVTDSAVGFLSFLGEASERRLIEMADGADIPVECVPGGRGESRLAEFGAPVVVECFGSRAGGDAVFVRECPETAELLALLARLDRESSFDALAGTDAGSGGEAGSEA